MSHNPRHTWAWQKRRLLVLPAPGSRPCHWCGAPATEVDHLVPVAAGGTDDLGNLVPSCQRCNRSKGKKVAAAWQASQARQPVWRSVYARRCPARIF